MIRPIRHGGIAILLIASSIATSKDLWSQTGKAGKSLLPPDGVKSAKQDQLGPTVKEAALTQSKFAAGGFITYQSLAGEQLFAWQLKPDLGPVVTRPRDVLIMVSTTASVAGRHYIAAQQLAETMMKNGAKGDRFSLWTVSTPGDMFTRNLTKNFIDTRAEEKQVKSALETLSTQYPAGDCDLKTALTKAIDTFEPSDSRQLVILYIGDGQSNDSPINAADRAALSKKMVDRKIAFFPVPLGMELDPSNLHGLATSTGGIVIRVALMQDKAEEAVTRIQQTMAAPIFYPTNIQLSAEVLECYPNKLPPVRGDAPTLLVGKMKQAKNVMAVLEGNVGGNPAKVSCKVAETVGEAELDNYFLVSMIDQWRNAKEQPALIRADRALAFAYETNRLAHEELLTSAQLAMHQHQLDAAAKLYDQAVKMVPHDREAKAGLKLIDGIKTGKVNRQALLEKMNDANRKLVKLDNKDGVVRLTADQLSKLVPNDLVQPGKAGDQPIQDPLKANRDRMIIEEQMLTQQIDMDIKIAMKDLQLDPDAAHERVRSALLRVKDHPDISDSVRDGLLKRLQNTLRTVSTEGAMLKLRRDDEQRAVAKALAEGDRAAMLRTEQERFAARFIAYKNLMNEARYDILRRQQATDQILKGMLQLQEEARVKGLPVPPATQSVYVQTLASYNLQIQHDLRVESERNFLAVMLEVEKSHVPLPDEPPIHFMTRLPASQQVKAWKLLSDRRIERYQNADLIDDPIARKDADTIGKFLNETMIETKSLAAGGANLKLVLSLIYEKAKSKGQNLPILVDVEAFKAENPDMPDLYETVVEFPPVPEEMSITMMLRWALSKIPTKNAIHVIRRNYIEVTTVDRQYAEKALRVYPVGDLVIPISSSTNPFSPGGGIGGIGGGIQGFGGGIQGFGGGIQGFGGGIQGFGGGIGGIGGGIGGIQGFGGGIQGFGGGIGGLQGFGGGFQGGFGGGGIGGFQGGFGGGGIGGFPGQIGGGFGGGFPGQIGGGGFGGVQGGFPGAQIPGQNCLGFNQFNGGLGAFGTSGLDQGLILLIKQVVAPGEWGGQNCQLQYSGTPMVGFAGGALGFGGFQGQFGGGFGGGNLGLPPFGGNLGNPAGGGLPGFPGAPGGNSPDLKDPSKVNDIAFYPTSLALIVRGTALKHYKIGGVLGGRKPADGPAKDDLQQQLLAKKPGAIIIGGNPDVRVAENKAGAAAEKVVALADPKQVWQEALSKGLQNPGLIVAAADFLFDEELYDHAAEFLKANLRHGILVEPWVYEALSIALEFSGAHPEEIQRARLSAMSLNPKDATSYIKAAQPCGEQGQYGRALAFCQQAAKLQPGLSSAYAEALALAEKGKDVKGMEWAVGKLISQDWADDSLNLHLKANMNLNKLVDALQREKRNDDATKLKSSVQLLKQRDLIVQLTWEPGASGDADLELEITEPTGTVCSSQYRVTPGGGTLSGLTLASQRKATYAASLAFSGEYQVTVKRLWGQPASGKFRLEIIYHQGTPQEKHRIETITLDQKHTLKFVLANGRRTDLAQVAPAAAKTNGPSDQLAKGEHVINKLRNIADQSGDRVPRGVAAAISKYRGAPISLPALPTKKQQEHLVFQGGASSNTGGVYLTTQGHLSADGQFLRLSVNPLFQPSVMGGRPQFDVPLIPGGSGF